jgi:FlaA1/EpsC-like NDP-sugar epimerase
MVVRNRYLLVSDIVTSVAAGVLAYTARFEGLGWMATEGRVLLAYLALAIPLRLIIRWSLGLYQRVWSLASIAEMERMAVAGVISGSSSVLVGTVGLTSLGLADHRIPLGVLLLDGLLAICGMVAPRIAVRISERRAARSSGRDRGYLELPGALIVGAGSAGQIAARELAARKSAGFRPVAFLDDDPRKHGLVVGDLPVLGASEDLAKVAMATGARFAVIAVPSASGDAIRTLVQRARQAGLESRIVPSLHEHIARASGAQPVRQVRIEDLLQREPIVTDTAAVRAMVAGNVVLVTGAGGSIGSELCRQLAAMNPSELVLVGRGENSIFEIQQELTWAYPLLPLTPVILDVRDAERMRAVMMERRPAAVFHAAAHKHVPLMEANVLEALRNNVLGTKSVVDAALAANVPRFVLISTDKAVRPTSVMGASKRIAEQVVQLAAQESGRPYVSVRFGNVLGSRGSVIPTFLKQIEQGGPVLITHPEMRRYFMTIPEAVQLVLQACVMGSGEEVFCLDMGEPVKIVDLAKDLIALTAGPSRPEIEIRFMGARPGEKLYEEMFFDAEHAQPTSHPKVLHSLGTQIDRGLGERLRTLLPTFEGIPNEIQLRKLLDSSVEDFRVEVVQALVMSVPLRVPPEIPPVGR